MGTDFPIKIQLENDGTIHKQLYQELKQSIDKGQLRPGDQLPSSKDLATKLGVSRTTVVKCYEELLQQNYVISMRGAGTRVNPDFRPLGTVSLEKVPLSEMAEGLLDSPVEMGLPSGCHSQLNFGTVDNSLLPIERWLKLINNLRKQDEQSVRSYQFEPFGYAPLREAIASYLTRTRNTKCDASQVCLFTGALFAHDLVLKLLINPGDVVAMEEPGFPYIRNTFTTYGARIYGLALDEHGVDISQLERLPDRVKVLYVTPSHQDPTGATLPIARRRQLLEWAIKKDVIIIEDDFDSELRHRHDNLQSLQGLDESGRVFYIGSFWKVLSPLVTVGYMILPPWAVSAATKMQTHSESRFPVLEELCLTKYISEGYLEKYVKELQNVYTSRRQALVRALKRHFGSHISVADECSGTHQLVRFLVAASQREIITHSEAVGLAAISTDSYYAGVPPVRREFLISFAALDEEQIDDKVRQFADKLCTLQ